MNYLISYVNVVLLIIFTKFCDNRYPFEPPRVTFITPVYHPNIDSGGRICLDILKMPPSGAWKPLINIEGVLVAICNLMNCPNPNDPLVLDIVCTLNSLFHFSL